MGFVTRINFPRLQPVAARVYLHRDGILFYNSMGDAVGYFLQTLRRHTETFPEAGHNFYLAGLWANRDGELIADYAGLQDVNPDNWSDNVAWPTWRYVDGVWSPETKMCGDEFIMVAEEEKFRRATKNLADFSAYYPNLGTLEPERTIIMKDKSL